MCKIINSKICILNSVHTRKTIAKTLEIAFLNKPKYLVYSIE